MFKTCAKLIKLAPRNEAQVLAFHKALGVESRTDRTQPDCRFIHSF